MAWHLARGWDDETTVEWITFENTPMVVVWMRYTGGAVGTDLVCGLVGTLAFLLYSRPMHSKGNEREGSKINNFLPPSASTITAATDEG